MNENPPPNILLIVVDQWRGDCLGMLGHPVVQTPNLDTLFAKGIAFTRAYSAVPSCIAARAGLLTGLSPENHGRLGYQDRVPWTYSTTMPGELSRAGYHTHCVGKMHVFPARNLMGFNSVQLHDGYLHTERCGTDDYTLSDDYQPWLQDRLGRDADITDAGLGCNGYTVRPWPYEERYHPTNWVTTNAIDFLRRRDTTKPFFLKVSYHRPHPPLDPPQHFLDRYMHAELPPLQIGDWVDRDHATGGGGDSPVPIDAAQIDLARRAYYAQLTHIDNQINRIMHALIEHKVMNNTLIAFVSDHGEMLYDHHLVAKSLGYDASARVPMLLRLPASAGLTSLRQVDSPVELRDLMPTFLDIAGAPIPETLDGQSLIPLCRGEGKDWRQYVHGEHVKGDSSSHWLVSGKELYIWYSQTGQEQYFDLTTDLSNCHDLSRSHSERVAYWRGCMINELQNRPEGFVNDGQLVVGRPLSPLMPALR